MDSRLDYLTKARDVGELHAALRRLESSCPAVDDAIALLGEAPEGPFLRALRGFLRARRSFWRGSTQEFESDATAALGYRSADDVLARYLSGRAANLLALHLCRQGDLKAASSWADEAAAVAGTGMPPLRAEALGVMARIQSAACQWDDAPELADASLRLATEAEDRIGQAQAWDALGRFHFEWGDFTRAAKDLQTSLELWTQSLCDLGRADTQLLQAHIAYHVRDADASADLLADAGRLCASLNYSRGRATVARYRGKLVLREAAQRGPGGEERKRELIEDAIRLFAESLTISQAVGDSAGEARAHLSLARAYAQKSDWPNANENYRRAEDLFGELKDDIMRATTLVTEGLVLAQQDRSDRTVIAALFDEALGTYREQGDRRHLASALFEIGEQYRRWGEYDRAAECLENAVNGATAMHAERLVERYQARADLTEEARRWARALLAARQQQDEMRILVRMAFHEPRNVLTYVSGTLQSIRSLVEADERTESLVDSAQAGGDYLKLFSDAMLKYLTAVEVSETPRLDLERTRFELAPVVDHALRVTRCQLRHPDDVALLNDVHPELQVWADKAHLTMILVNLLGNAAKFTMKGHLRVSAGLHEGGVQVTVEDTGFGVVPELRDRIFDPSATGADYTRLTEKERAERGYGVGLAYCRLAVHSHGGRIWVDLERTRREGEDEEHPEYHGTVIHFTLPEEGNAR